MAIIKRADGTVEEVKKATEIEFSTGDRITFLTAGGGGYGDPRQRPREAVAADLALGLVSPAAAARDYGFDAEAARPQAVSA
jgi:N-methylhydantoinase B